MPITMMTSGERPMLSNVEHVPNYPGAEMGVRHSVRCKHHTGERTDTTRVELSAECVREHASEADAIAAGITGQDIYTWRQACHAYAGIYLRTTHVGLVISTGEYNGYHDSDFFADVWNDEKGCIERVEYASTRGWTYPNSATVDATPEVLAKVAAYYQRMADAHAEKRRVEREAAEAERAEIEVQLAAVRKLKGSVVKLGKREGELFWVGVAKTGKSVRVGIRTPAGDVHWGAGSSIK